MSDNVQSSTERELLLKAKAKTLAEFIRNAHHFAQPP